MKLVVMTYTILFAIIILITNIYLKIEEHRRFKESYLKLKAFFKFEPEYCDMSTDFDILDTKYSYNKYLVNLGE